MNRNSILICLYTIVGALAWPTLSEGNDVNIRELLDNRGVSEELLETPRAHPYLFFKADDLPRLREMAAQEPYRACAEGILRTARLTLGNPIPDEPDPGAVESRLPDGAYDESFLKATYDFLSYAYAMEYYGPLYAFAYLLTGEERFAERAKAWALAFAGWKNWGPAGDPWDMEGAMILSGAVIVYDWLPDHFSEAEKRELFEGLKGKGQKLCEKDARWLGEDPVRRRGGLANNHRWRSIPLEGLAGLGLLYEIEEARDWLDMGLVLTRDYLLPAAYGRDGERMEGRGWLAVCLVDGGRFMDALVRNGGPDLFDHPPLRQLSQFLLYGVDMYQSQGSHSERAGLLVHAGRLRDPALQWLALEHDLEPDPEDYPSYWYYRDKVLYEAGVWQDLCTRWDAATGKMTMEVNGEVRDTQETGDGEGVDSVLIDVEGDAVEVASLEVRAESGNPVAQIEGPRSLSSGDDPIGLAFPALESGEVRVRIRKTHSNEGVARISLMAGEQSVRGIVLTDSHEITKAVPGQEGSHTLGVVAAEGLWFHGPWELLFYDGDLRPESPAKKETSHHFRDLGLVKMRDTFDPGGVHISFASGPELSKEQGDKNAFTLRAFGEDLLMPIRTPKTGEAKLTQAQYDLTAWYEGTPGRNTLLVNGRGQPTVHEESPVRRDYDIQWLSGEEVVKSGTVEEAFLSPYYDYARGEAAYAYRPLLEIFRRHLMLVKPCENADLRYVILFDEIVAAEGAPAEIEWRLLTRCEDLSSEEGVTRIDGERAGLQVTHLMPDPSGVVIDRTPAPRERDRRPFARFPTSGPVEGVQYLHVLQPMRRPSPDAPLRPERVEGTNGVGVRVAEPEREVFAVFRADGNVVSSGGLRTDAYACLLVTRADTKPRLTVHGGTFVEWEGRRVFEASARTSEVVDLE